MIDIGEADVLIAEIASKQARIDALEQEAKQIKEAQIAKVDKWLSEKTQKLKEDIDVASAMLVPIVEDCLAELERTTGIKQKSYKFPSGRAGFRCGGISFNFNSSEEKVDGKSELLLKVVKDHNLDYVLTKEYANWYKLKKSLKVTDEGKVVTSDGEVLPELSAKVEPDKFYVKVGD